MTLTSDSEAPGGFRAGGKISDLETLPKPAKAVGSNLNVTPIDAAALPEASAIPLPAGGMDDDDHWLDEELELREIRVRPTTIAEADEALVEYGRRRLDHAYLVGSVARLTDERDDLRDQLDEARPTTIPGVIRQALGGLVRVAFRWRR